MFVEFGRISSFTLKLKKNKMASKMAAKMATNERILVKKTLFVQSNQFFSFKQ